MVTDLTREGLRLRHDAIVNSSADAIYSLTPEGTIRRGTEPPSSFMDTAPRKFLAGTSKF